MRVALASALLVVALGCGAGTPPDAGGATDAGAFDARQDSSDARDAATMDAGAAHYDACAGDALAGFDRGGIAPPDRDSNAYVAPTVAQRSATRAMVEAALEGDVAMALSSASSAGYDACVVGDLLRLTPSAHGTGRAFIALRLAGARALVVAAPHAWHETNTLDEARALFERVSARALVVTGSHRCASPERSACDGTTSVCDASALPFRRSDAAHNADTDFQAAHEALYAFAPSDLYVNLHGMSAAGVRVSDGTQDATDSTSPLSRFAAALSAAYPSESIEACSPGAGVSVATSLCGTTNVQGRLVNASADACSARATSASGRFLHVEQSRAVRDDFDGIVLALNGLVAR